MPDEPRPARSLDELADVAVRRGHQLRRRDRVRWTVAITLLIAVIGGSIPFLLSGGDEIKSGLVDDPDRRSVLRTEAPDDGKDDETVLDRSFERVDQLRDGGSSPAPTRTREIGRNEPLIAFVGHRDTPNPLIRTMDPFGGGGAPLIPDVDSDQTDPDWSPDGNSLAFIYDRALYTLDLDSRAAVAVARAPDRDDSSPSWSPDGKRIVFASRSGATAENATSQSDLWIANADGSGLRRLTNTAATDETAPDWSPDGRTIIFARNGGSESAGIFATRPDGSGTRRLTTGQDLEPSWSPNGRSIAFTRYNTAAQVPSDIYAMNADGSGQRNLTDTVDLFEYTPDWAPDGKFLVYTRDPDGRVNPANDPFANAIACYSVRQRCQTEASGIYSMRADGSGVTMITGYSNGDSSPAYRPT